jgi:uncharacterized OsmC-like protein
MLEINVFMEQVRDYEFRVRFEDAVFGELTMDGPGRMGHGAGPSPSQLLAAAIGNCLCGSLLLAARMKGVRVGLLRAEVKTRMEQDEQNRWRIHKAQVTVHPKFESGAAEQIQECLALCEELCAVTNSVREGIEVNVEFASAAHAAPSDEGKSPIV